MDAYSLITFEVQIGLLTIEMARELRSFFEDKDSPSQNEVNQQRIIAEALKTLERLNIEATREEPFSNTIWLHQFISGVQDISNIPIQEMCGRILAQEFVSPGVTPQRMGQILAGISYEDMQKFQKIIRPCLKNGRNCSK